MGSSTKPKPRGQPASAATPGSATGQNTLLGRGAGRNALVVPLIRVDRDTAGRVKIGSPVGVRIGADFVSVTWLGQRLGDIPPRFHTALQLGYRAGNVTALVKNPFKVIVTLYR